MFRNFPVWGGFSDRPPCRIAFLTYALLSLGLSCTILAGCWKEPSKFNWKNAPGAEQYERLMWQAIREKEWIEMEHHLAPGFIGVAASGEKFDTTGWVGYWKGVQVSDVSLGDLTVRPQGPDMVVAYDLQLKAAAVPPTQLRVISVWQQLKKGWVLISQSNTPVKVGN